MPNPLPEDRFTNTPEDVAAYEEERARREAGQVGKRCPTCGSDDLEKDRDEIAKRVADDLELTYRLQYKGGYELAVADKEAAEQALASQTKLLREVAEDFEKRADEAEAMADRQDGPQGWPTAQANRQGAVAFREAASLLRSRLSTVEGAEKK